MSNKTETIRGIEKEIKDAKWLLSIMRESYYLFDLDVDNDKFNKTQQEIDLLEQELLMERYGSSMIYKGFNWNNILSFLSGTKRFNNQSNQQILSYTKELYPRMQIIVKTVYL